MVLLSLILTQAMIKSLLGCLVLIGALELKAYYGNWSLSHKITHEEQTSGTFLWHSSNLVKDKEYYNGRYMFCKCIWTCIRQGIYMGVIYPQLLESHIPVTLVLVVGCLQSLPSLDWTAHCAIWQSQWLLMHQQSPYHSWWPPPPFPNGSHPIVHHNCHHCVYGYPTTTLVGTTCQWPPPHCVDDHHPTLTTMNLCLKHDT